MRRIIASFCIAAVLPLGACKRVDAGGSAATAAESKKPALEMAFDVPAQDAAQSVHFLTRDIPPGGEIPWHTHPGVEMGYVESGELELRMQGKGPLKLSPGDSFRVTRGIVHGGFNVGKEPARVVITYVIDSGEPLRSPADPPQDH